MSFWTLSTPPQQQKQQKENPYEEDVLRQHEHLEKGVSALITHNEELHESCIQSLMAQRKLKSEVIEMRSNAIAREKEIDRLRNENEELRQMVRRWQDWYKARENLRGLLVEDEE